MEGARKARAKGMKQSNAETTPNRRELTDLGLPLGTVQKQAVGDAWGARPTVFPKSHSELHGFESAVDMVGYTALLG